MTRPTRADLAAAAGTTVDDLLAPEIRVLFVGINPGLWTAAVNAHFARPGNRFWPALHDAGITPWLVDASEGMRAEDRAMLAGRGVGITNLVPVATARADELTAAQVRAGAAALEAKVRVLGPRVVAVLGLTAYRQGFAERGAVEGQQTRRLGGCPTWVLPNPSGLNAHATRASLATSFAAVWAASAQDG